MGSMKEFYESPQVDAVTIGKVLFEHRKKKGLSQEIQSGLAGIGRTQYSTFERGTRKPTYSEFKKLCDSFDSEPAVILEEIKSRLGE